MKNEKLYNELEDIAKRLGLKVLKGRGNFSGGKCKVNNEFVIVVNKMKPIEHRLKTLASCFLDYDLENIHMVPAARAFIEQYRT